MLERRIKQEIRDFLDGDRKEALMVTGAETGKGRPILSGNVPKRFIKIL